MPSLQANRLAAQVQQVVLQQVVLQQVLRRLRVRAVLRVVPLEERQVALPEELRVVLPEERQVVPRAVPLEELRVVLLEELQVELQVERQLVALRLLERQPEPQALSQVPLVQRLQVPVWRGLSPRQLWLQRQ